MKRSIVTYKDSDDAIDLLYFEDDNSYDYEPSRDK